MNKICLIGFFLSLYLFGYEIYGQNVRIIPQPAKIVTKPGAFVIDSATQIVNPSGNNEIKTIATFLTSKLEISAGFILKISNQVPVNNAIVLKIDSSLVMNEEGYNLSVTFQNIAITAKTGNGLFYGIQTLLQLLPPQIDSKNIIKPFSWNIPCVEIKDYPQFHYRGMHLDVSRHFFSVDFIKKQLDIMASYKLNTFHWHLTDDQGWRIEIKKYPKLIEVGSKRIEPDGTIYQGYYTQDQIRDVIAYAKDRYIDVLPEIDMPGHATAALASYPENSCTGGPFQVRNTWETDESFCPGKDQTFTFINDIITEVAQLFPYEYIHIGGDECRKEQWKTCPYCQARKKEKKLKNEKQLQSYFVKRVEKIVLAHGKRIIGWDEILEGGLAPNATVMSWRDEKGGMAAANQHHDVIMCPQKWLYLDHYQGSEKVEPVALKGLVTLEDVYKYNPIPKKLASDRRKYVIGTQANIWSEYLYSPEKAEYIAYPRALAFSEVAWSSKKNKDFPNFVERLNNQFPRFDFKDVNYHIPLPEGPVNTEAFIDTLNLTFSNTRSSKMVYTLDGSEPGINSIVYTNPIHISGNTTIRIRTVLPTGEMSNVRTINAVKQTFEKSIEVETQPGLCSRITYGKYANVKQLDTAQFWTDDIMFDLKSKFNYKDPSAVVLTGYIDIPKSNVYYFSTNLEQFWIGGRLLISNEGEVKNHSRNDASIALAEGKHEIKLIFLNNIVGGRPSAINGLRLFLRTKSDDKPKVVESSMLSH